jgi:hypothetical protein
LGNLIPEEKAIEGTFKDFWRKKSRSCLFLGTVLDKKTIDVKTQK